MILPDTTAAAVMRTRMSFASPQVVSHVSGRPWLVGSWSDDRITVATAGPVRVAVIGDCPISQERLTELTAAVTTVADVDKLASALPGSAHLMASVDGQVRAQGSISGLSRIFYTRIDGVHVASDRAHVLAEMVGAVVDEQSLAVRLASGLALAPPLSERCLWAGISSLAPERCLVWTRDQADEKVWWNPPAPHLSLRDGAAGVREALTGAVQDRAPAQGRVSADLSGGMDSTSLCFLAARHTPALLTLRWAEADAANDDADFAGQAIQALDRAEHLVVAQRELPSIFDTESIPVDAEQPMLTMRAAARLRHNAQLLAQRGSRRHLAGHGGDELFQPSPGYLAPLLRHHPVLALRRLRQNRALKRWSLRPALTGLLRPGTVAGWWHDQADNLHTVRPQRAPAMGWGLHAVQAQSWMTPAGVDLIRQALRLTAHQAQPLSDDLGQHQTLLAVRTTAAHYRLMARIYADVGVNLDLPYYDQRVLEAVLRVRPHEHADPRRYKPLLAEAMRGIVPPAILGRATKGEFGLDLRQGLADNLPSILNLFADSALAQRGLIDADTLRNRLLAPQRDLSMVFALEALLGCELWLRTAARPARQPREHDAPAPAP
ncbi:asparagine synthase [Streptomyces coeruleorubidus]|uniref:asparagine synthase-related protein n=1 Tax=Streptomyces coeruleorubidus TaxID=116188 RepID=UPI00198C2966|nr:asparagine synthase-related protein [Streptomyces coeruleorubidus]GGT91261.1 asparagine synthase [Streptomyces coeruleorubidus]